MSEINFRNLTQNNVKLIKQILNHLDNYSGRLFKKEKITEDEFRILNNKYDEEDYYFLYDSIISNIRFVKDYKPECQYCDKQISINNYDYDLYINTKCAAFCRDDIGCCCCGEKGEEYNLDHRSIDKIYFCCGEHRTKWLKDYKKNNFDIKLKHAQK